jgi:hypothetical protein
MIRHDNANLERTAVDLPAIDHRLGRIEDEMKSIAEAMRLLSRVDERLHRHREDIDDHEDRLRLLEKTATNQSGALKMVERGIWLVVTVGLALVQFA